MQRCVGIGTGSETARPENGGNCQGIGVLWVWNWVCTIAAPRSNFQPRMLARYLACLESPEHCKAPSWQQRCGDGCHGAPLRRGNLPPLFVHQLDELAHIALHRYIALQIARQGRAGMYRQEVKHADFARIMPKIIAHLRKVATKPPHAEGVDYPPGDFLPTHVLLTYRLLPWLDTLDTIHAQLGTDLDAATLKEARRRLVFNEMLLLSIMMLQHRASMQGANEPRGQEPVVCSDLVPCHP
jgi:hypothetical protein